MTEITLELLWGELQEIKALLLQMKRRVMPRTTSEKIQQISELGKEKGELNTHDVVDVFGVSPRVSLDYLKKAAGDGLVFCKGHASNPSKLMVLSEKNRFDIIAVSVIDEMKLGERGTTKCISSIMAQHNIQEKDLQQLLPKIVRYSNHKIVMADPNATNPITKRRLVYRGGL